MISFTLNGQAVQTDADPSTPLLWVVRDHFKLKGSKFGCGAGLCGACTMHVDGAAMKTCVTPIAAVADKSITTIEGLGTPEDLHPLQAAWHEHAVPQCGYCQRLPTRRSCHADWQTYSTRPFQLREHGIWIVVQESETGLRTLPKVCLVDEGPTQSSEFEPGH